MSRDIIAFGYIRWRGSRTPNALEGCDRRQLIIRKGRYGSNDRIIDATYLYPT